MSDSSISRRESSRKRKAAQCSLGSGVDKPIPAASAANKQTMTAVFIERAGGPNALVPQEVACPEPKLNAYEVLIRVAYIGVNRLDLEQRLEGLKGTDGKRFCPGLECSGVIEAVGEKVRHKVGDSVCAFLDSGGYTEKIVLPSWRVLCTPPDMDLRNAACLPEAAYTGWSALSRANLGQGKTILIHESCGDVAVFAIQMAKYLRAKVFAAADSLKKQEFYKTLGADKCFNYRNADFVSLVQRQARETGGIDVVLDSWAINLRKNLKILCNGGLLLYVDVHGFSLEVLQIDSLMSKNANIQVLCRSDKSIDSIQELKASVWPAICAGHVKPFIYECYPLSQAAKAHKAMERKYFFQRMLSALGPWTSKLERHVYTGMVEKCVTGKILLRVDSIEEVKRHS
ncbi:quinone oxidoreductase-like isoform X3 [Coffea eugenioides]|uniref:Quinone oxidoreductase-like isoform X3 n=1 Tax=Coffea arabica TaxID=13443 RepID=A0A6P6TDY0_COFAR|nr:quinone oxidoreductase-like isoform X3 [Coffea arabica]XP_027076147.1 quinone oxidoreductase-like isoform X3 [Coffea arabica]XP_027178310.1 quinone oxidoreductase-like isoform X3 [Coffea eugenioides]